MAEKYIMLDMGDERAGRIAEVIGNASCKRILNLLAEREMSESDLAAELKIPLNTVEYNIRKLVEAGLIEETKKFFWSTRGKRIKSYRVVNKKIVISPRSSFRGIVPAVIAAVLGAIGIKMFIDSNVQTGVKELAVNEGSQMLTRGAEGAVSSGVAEGIRAVPSYPGGREIVSGCANYLTSEAWAWFLLGALIVALIIVIWNWREK